MAVSEAPKSTSFPAKHKKNSVPPSWPFRRATRNNHYLRIPAKDPRRFGSPSGRRSNRVRFSPLGVPESLKNSEQHLLFVVRHLIEDIHIRFELPALACPSLDREWRLPLQLEQRKARGRYS